MHFEILVEDASGEILLDRVLKKILGENGVTHTWRQHPYKGVGRIPKNLRKLPNRGTRILLEHLLRLIRGYGKSLDESSSVVVVVDLDDRDCMAFKAELLDVLEACNPRPRTLFRIAIEESEAWLLGDREALKTAYPNAKAGALSAYEQDSICGTWERLADAVHRGGAAALKRAGWRAAGTAKCEWADKIGAHMNPDRNRSKSFQVFRDGVRKLASLDV